MSTEVQPYPASSTVTLGLRVTWYLTLEMSWAVLNLRTINATSYTSERPRLAEPFRRPEKCTQQPCTDYGLTSAHLQPL
jgi:hypothetical protein